MPASEPVRLELEVARIRRQVRVLHVAFAAVLVAGCAAGALRSTQEPQAVLRVRGIVVEDEQGRARILLGAPVPQVAGRVRRDPASGLVLLDADGRDRLQLGGVGGPQMGGTVQPRIADATGLMVCDAEGDERAGFGWFANGQVGWGLDYDGGEAIVAAVLPEQGLAGIIVNADVKDGPAQRAALLSTRNGASLRLSGGNGVERAVLRVGGLGAPVLEVFDERGALQRDALSAK